MNRRAFLRNGLAAAATMLPATALRAARLQNDLDMRPFARAIVKKTQNIIDKNKTGIATVLMLGETHSRPAHVITQLLVLEELAQQGVDYTVGIELPYDTVFKAFARETGRINDRHLIDDIHALDPNGKLALRCAALYQDTYGPQSHRMLWYHLQDRNIPAFFCDASWSPYRVDVRDPNTINIARTVLQRDIMTLPLTSVDGVRVRNTIMSRFLQAHALRDEVPLIVHLCGSAHIYGVKNPLHPYDFSLTKMLDDMDVPSIGAPFLVKDYNGILPAHTNRIDGLNLPEPYATQIRPESAILRDLLIHADHDPAMADVADKIAALAPSMNEVFAKWNGAYPPVAGMRP